MLEFKYFEIRFWNDTAIVLLVPEIYGCWVLSRKKKVGPRNFLDIYQSKSGFKYFEILFCNDAAIVLLVPEICGCWVLSKKNTSEEFPRYFSIKVEIQIFQKWTVARYFLKKNWVFKDLFESWNSNILKSNFSMSQHCSFSSIIV